MCQAAPLWPFAELACKSETPAMLRGRSHAYSHRLGLAPLGGGPRNTRDIRAADPNIGKLTVAQARQFVQTAVIALPLLDEANECGKHGILLSVISGPRPVVD